MHLYLWALEIVSSLEIPEVEWSVISTRYHYVISIDGKAIKNGIVARKILNKLAFGALPLFDIIRRGGCKHVAVT